MGRWGEHHYGGIFPVAISATRAVVPIALRLRYDNLVSPVLAHSIHNLIDGLAIAQMV